MVVVVASPAAQPVDVCRVGGRSQAVRPVGQDVQAKLLGELPHRGQPVVLPQDDDHASLGHRAVFLVNHCNHGKWNEFRRCGLMTCRK